MSLHADQYMDLIGFYLGFDLIYFWFQQWVLIISRQPAGREIVKCIPCMGACLRECVCHIFKKGCTSHWLFSPIQCFMTLLLMSFHLMLFFQT